MGVYCYKEASVQTPGLLSSSWGFVLGNNVAVPLFPFSPHFHWAILWPAIKMKCGGQFFGRTVVPCWLPRHQGTCQRRDKKRLCWPWLTFCLDAEAEANRDLRLGVIHLCSDLSASHIKQELAPGGAHAPVLQLFCCPTVSVSQRYLPL